MSGPLYLLHVTQADRWPAVLSNLANLADLGCAGRVRVMINGTAIYVLQGDNDWTRAMHRAAEAGTVLEVCQRSLANHGIDPGSLPEWITPVRAAIPVIAEHTAAGCTYIKP
ncbi:CoA biosynthesis protein CoaBC [Actinomyces bowdenii]|uniref:CoA biosynthesis protein CoaBC n=1 Tax=Actinomyces bowdenii TaxID=131109 RepID=A0A3P1V747_9ACTO|nr:CoA biosynthesis protein CoaBC [Actinomyces bowdenii]MBO3725492.1 CoA biosynthesis protein CoaBC [Actinomyces bowdenii]RRD29165.1 CoA biosynthesis protein CoaBC [Actinomyces bowdenii]